LNKNGKKEYTDGTDHQFAAQFCMLHQAVKFDFTADLMGTGNRSEEVTK